MVYDVDGAIRWDLQEPAIVLPKWDEMSDLTAARICLEALVVSKGADAMVIERVGIDVAARLCWLEEACSGNKTESTDKVSAHTRQLYDALEQAEEGTLRRYIQIVDTLLKQAGLQKP